MHQQSIRDPLTGLFIRRYLTDTLKHNMLRLQKNNSTLAFLLIDIDHFKQFNDTYGHDAGDAVLKHVAHLLELHAKEKNAFVCRFGGEEFIIALENVTLAEAESYGEEIRQKIQEENFKYNNTNLGTITFSIGIAMYPEHGKSLDVLFNASDSSLYKAKESGRNRIVVATQ